MEQQNFTIAITVDAAAHEVLEKIKQIQLWWTKDFEGRSTNINDEFTIRHGDIHYSKQKLVELVPGKKIAWLVTDSRLNWLEKDKHEWTGTKMVFELITCSGATTVNLTHEGLVPEKECYTMCTQGWEAVIKNNLFNFLMQNERFMPNNNYTATIEVAADPEVVFNQITDMTKWWTKNLTGGTKKLNDEFIIAYGEGVHYSKHKLVEVIPGKKLVWLVTESKIDWIEKDKQEWTNTKMIFEISASGYKTVIHFTHEGLVPQQECYKNCSAGWDMFIKDKLYNLITFGKEI